MTLNETPAATVPNDWWRGATIYQIYPRSFADSNGDGIGDLPGITAKLDYVASLGVDAIWLSPFFTSPMTDYGYDVADYCDVDPIFGTLADFDALLARAHALGLKVIIDQVYAHTSDAHEWFKASRTSRDNAHSDWYVWADAKPEGSPPNNWQSVFGGPAWTWDARRGQYYLHNFLNSQPQLNVHNPQVQDALLAAATFWLDKGVDGFRLDALNFAMHNRALTDNPPETKNGVRRTRPFDFQQKLHNQSQPQVVAFIERIRKLTDSYGARFTVAEVGGEQAEREQKLFTHGVARLNTAYGFEFLYADSITPSLVAETVTKWADTPEMGWPSWAFSNHDAPRAISRWAQGRDAAGFAKQMLLLLLCLRGNAFVYQGEELGLPQADVPFDRLCDPEAIANWPLTLSRDGARTPLPWTSDAPWGEFSTVEPWLPMDAAHLALAVERQEADPGSSLHFARAVIALRKANAALRVGNIIILEASQNVLAFTRGTGADERLCVFNLGQTDANYVPTGTWHSVYAVHGATPDRPLLPLLGGYIAKRA